MPRFLTRSTVLLVAALGGLATAPAGAADPAALASAMAQFRLANAGQESAIAGAVAQWTALSAAEPNDPVLRAYAGAATAMQAATTLLPWRKMGYAEDGLALIDKALAQLTPAHDAASTAAVPGVGGVPASLETRFVAASTFLGMPAMLNRGARGAKLLDDVARSPLLDASPLGFRGAVWLRAGIEAAKAKRNDEARLWLEKASSSGAPQAAAAQARLKDI